MAINMFQRSVDLSAKVAHIEVPLVFSETTRSIELKFYMKTPYDRLANFFTKCSGHMTKMATAPIYSKKNLRYRLWNQKANALGTWYVG